MLGHMTADGRLPTLLARLPADDREAVLSIAKRQKHRRVQPVFLEGDPGDSLHLIVNGKVAIRVTTVDGDVVTLTVLGAGDSFGEVALVSESVVRTAAVYALEPTETLVVRRRDFDELRARQPAVERLLVEVLARMVTRLTGQVSDALYAPVERRVARRLLDLVEVYREGAGAVSVPLTQEDLASMAGTTRPTCNRILRDLIAEKKLAFMNGFVGKPVEVITLNVCGSNHEGKYTEGLSDNYLQVRLLGNHPPNRWLPAKVERVSGGALLGIAS
jgi:CRP-like cAMP-binding protein